MVENLPGATFFRKFTAAPPFLPSKMVLKIEPKVYRDLFARNSKTVYKQRLVHALLGNVWL